MASWGGPFIILCAACRLNSWNCHALSGASSLLDSDKWVLNLSISCFFSGYNSLYEKKNSVKKNKKLSIKKQKLHKTFEIKSFYLWSVFFYSIYAYVIFVFNYTVIFCFIFSRLHMQFNAITRKTNLLFTFFLYTICIEYHNHYVHIIITNIKIKYITLTKWRKT